MAPRPVWFCLALLIVPAHGAWAQVVVQLPTFTSFTVLTTVMVPDSGGAYMGGVRRAASGRSQFGAPWLRGNVATGSERQAAGMHMTATIHDFETLDKALLAGGARRFVPPQGEVGRKLAQARESSAGVGIASVDELKRQQAAAETAQNAEALALIEKARTAETEGKLGLARIHYQMASRRASGTLCDEIAQRLQALERMSKPSKVAAKR
jgi:hypothetical protein